MAFTSANLWNADGLPPGRARYVYISDTDDREDVMLLGYFNNADDNLNLASGDLIEVRGNAGFYTLRVDTVTAGVVATELAGQPVWVSARYADVSGTTSYWGVAPTDGVIRRMQVVLEGAVSADTTFGLELGGTNVTDNASADIVTALASGSAAGVVSAGEADGANTVVAGQAIEFTCGGEGVTASAATALVEIIPA